MCMVASSGNSAKANNGAFFANMDLLQILVNPEKFDWKKLDAGIPPTAVPCGRILDDRDMYVAACEG